MKLGMAGLGRMGVPMAKNLINAGFDIQVWNRNAAPASCCEGDHASLQPVADLDG